MQVGCQFTNDIIYKADFNGDLGPESPLGPESSDIFDGLETRRSS
ncbi:unnamed protein product [Acanthoscelides obtectus]|uniref:Uncharacterized protein n=1 Tax=Acanthoscelides obtectus TaxID=200917 RepID=A0A9P0PZD6_ACAOB|nr:unnamed protein product [Acanthoscelides obtectus]CAK1629907.1 hypothetical protein AOBTE_LOCUS6029 [Acanthoscelides obtectus]